MCIARTDPDVPKHRGLTMFAVPMDTPGITIRPLVQATGDTGFNEVSFAGVRIPADHVLGQPGQGWTVTLSMLMSERVSLGASGSSLVSGWTAPVLADAPQLGGDRQVLADLHAREEVLRYVALRVRAAGEAGRPPGPEGSIAKLAGSDLVRRAATAHLHQHGPAGMAWLPDDEAAAARARAFVQAPSFSIAGGTSEIQRNIIGERVLGLPREPEADRSLPFRDVPQNHPPR
jgi:alkylation response protein AidB-like acyl-CoA dehydrogenase